MKMPTRTAVKAVLAATGVLLCLASTAGANEAPPWPADLDLNQPSPLEYTQYQSPGYDPLAPYCRMKTQPPNGRIVSLEGYVFHKCPPLTIIAPSAGYTVRGTVAGVSPHRVPRLNHARGSSSFSLEVYDAVLPQHIIDRKLYQLRKPFVDFKETIVLSGRPYKKFINRDYTYTRKPPNSPYPFTPDQRLIESGNFYLYDYLSDTSAERLPAHGISCAAENWLRIHDIMIFCHVSVFYAPPNGRSTLWLRMLIAGESRPDRPMLGFADENGKRNRPFTPIYHEVFPTLVEDMVSTIREMDVTDKPERQACIAAGRWWTGNDLCVDPPPRAVEPPRAPMKIIRVPRRKKGQEPPLPAP